MAQLKWMFAMCLTCFSALSYAEGQAGGHTGAHAEAHTEVQAAAPTKGLAEHRKFMTEAMGTLDEATAILTKVNNLATAKAHQSAFAAVMTKFKDISVKGQAIEGLLTKEERVVVAQETKAGLMPKLRALQVQIMRIGSADREALKPIAEALRVMQ